MIVLSRHRALTDDVWSELAVRAAIEEIAADAIDHFRSRWFLARHPSDDGVGDGNTSFYVGAAGVIWALDYLHRIVCATRAAKDFRPVLPKLLERQSPLSKAIRQPIMRSTARCSSATWARHLWPCALHPHQCWPIWLCARRSKYCTADPGAHVGHARIDAAQIHMAEVTHELLLARPVRSAGGPAVRRPGAHAARSALDTGSLWCRRPLARARSRLPATSSRYCVDGIRLCWCSKRRWQICAEDSCSECVAV